MKECPQCHRPRNVAEFRGIKWLDHLCRRCRWKALQEQTAREAREHVKRCSMCGEFKPWSEYRASRKRFGLASECNPCSLARSRARHATDRLNRKPRTFTRDRIDLIVKIDRECGGLPELVAVRLREMQAVQ